MSYERCPKCEWITNTEESNYCNYCGYSFDGIPDESIFSPYMYQADYIEDFEQIDKNRIMLIYIKIIEKITGMKDIADNSRDNSYGNLEDNEDFSWWKERLFDDIKEVVVDMLDEVNEHLSAMFTEGKCEKIPLYIFDKDIERVVSDIYEPLIDMHNDGMIRIRNEVDRTYEREVRENGRMGFGILTNSFVGAALYAVQSGVKEAKAEINASENRALSRMRKISDLEGEITDFWRNEFDTFFMSLFTMLQSMMIETLEEIILSNSGYTWDDVYEWIQSF